MITAEQRERLMEILRRGYELQYTVQILELDYMQVMQEIEEAEEAYDE